MLDLASELIAGATLAEVSTVLYYKVLQYAGYSRNLKVAAFERKLKKDGRYSEFGVLIPIRNWRTMGRIGRTIPSWPTACCRGWRTACTQRSFVPKVPFLYPARASST